MPRKATKLVPLPDSFTALAIGLSHGLMEDGYSPADIMAIFTIALADTFEHAHNKNNRSPAEYANLVRDNVLEAVKAIEIAKATLPIQSPGHEGNS